MWSSILRRRASHEYEIWWTFSEPDPVKAINEVKFRIEACLGRHDYEVEYVRVQSIIGMKEKRVVVVRLRSPVKAVELRNLLYKHLPGVRVEDLDGRERKKFKKYVSDVKSVLADHERK